MKRRERKETEIGLKEKARAQQGGEGRVFTGCCRRKRGKQVSGNITAHLTLDSRRNGTQEILGHITLLLDNNEGKGEDANQEVFMRVFPTRGGR